MNVKRRQNEILVIFLLSYSVVCQGPTITCPTTGGPAPTIEAEGAWSSWRDCNVKCGEGDSIRDRACVYTVPQVGGKCDETAIDSTTRDCTENDPPVQFSGGMSEWSSWEMCDFDTCGHAPLYNGRRVRLSCATTANQCQYVQHVQERKYCQKPKESPAVFKLSTDVNETEPGWREA